MKLTDLREFAPTPKEEPLKLVNVKTGKEVEMGDEVVDFRGDKFYVQGWKAPHKPAASGYIYVTDDKSKVKLGMDDPHALRYYPSVFDCKWINRTDQG